MADLAPQTDRLVAPPGVEGFDRLRVLLRRLGRSLRSEVLVAPDSQRDDQGDDQQATDHGQDFQRKRLVAVGAELLLDLFKDINHVRGLRANGRLGSERRNL